MFKCHLYQVGVRSLPCVNPTVANVHKGIGKQVL
jgi:hypothetical protein